MDSNNRITPGFIKVVRDKNSSTPILHELQCRFFENAFNESIKKNIDDMFFKKFKQDCCTKKYTTKNKLNDNTLL